MKRENLGPVKSTVRAAKPTGKGKRRPFGQSQVQVLKIRSVLFSSLPLLLHHTRRVTEAQNESG